MPAYPDGETVPTGDGKPPTPATLKLIWAFETGGSDQPGRLWCGTGDGVDCYDPDGTLIGKIAVSERVANLTFGGPHGDELLMCATSSLYRLKVNTRGAARPSA